MIIIGFPGIGKSSVAYTQNNNFIDLESSYFPKTGNWYENYCNLAGSLNLQGFHVFVSSHKQVRDYFISQFGEAEKCVEVFPDNSLEKYWISRLENRYNFIPTLKNKVAYEAVKNNYQEFINDMRQDKIKNKLILTEKMDLNDLETQIILYGKEIK